MSSKKSGPKPVPEADPLATRVDELAIREKIKMLMSGKMRAPTDIVRYLVSQFRAARAEFEATDSAIRSLEEQLVKLKEKKLVLQGGVNKYLEDVEHWLSEAETPQSEESTPKEAEVVPLESVKDDTDKTID